FQPVRQGMFHGGSSSWPPVRDEDAEADRTQTILELETQRVIRHSDHYDIYYLPSESVTRDLDAIVRAPERAFALAGAAIGAPPAGYRIRLFVYEDEHDKEERSGVKDLAHSLPGQGEMHLVLRLARNPAYHEEVHLIARQVLGACFLTSLYEGLALSEDGAF